ncbi:MAG: di-trans,poly-cis-decaprenylcistransferase [Bacilli bacterium]|nr:di-trans,poly-cis-decaprenylcistransferase [Bacilli bacterium]
MNKELNIPKHVGIIMDGNGRWAQERGMIRTMGHKNAIKTLKALCLHMADLGIKYASLYAFSTENFKREKSEVDYLMDLFITSFKKEFRFLIEKNVRVVFSGRREPLPQKVLDAMDKIVEDTKDNKDLVLNICLNYGSHAEMVDTTKKICEMYKKGDISLDEIDEDFIQKNLYQDLPPLDFVIRTSGELRLSNFMMYQASYAEFYFPQVYFPDFTPEEFDKAMLVFNKRNRRFGGVKK